MLFEKNQNLHAFWKTIFYRGGTLKLSFVS